MSELLHAAQRGIAKRMGVRSRETSKNQLLLIDNEAVTVRELCEKSGLSGKIVRQRFKAGKRRWVDFGVCE